LRKRGGGMVQRRFKVGFAASAPQIKPHPKIPFICVSTTRA
jgi:hypothetical protein